MVLTVNPCSGSSSLNDIGNGVQKAFYDDPNVLYISLHVYADGRFYPAGPDGDMDQCGEGAGIGKYVHVLLPLVSLTKLQPSLMYRKLN